MELDNASISPGSQFITVENASGGAADWGIFTFDDIGRTLWTVLFSYTLASAPLSYRLTFMAPSGNTIVIGGNALTGASTSQFQIQLQGPCGDLVHSVRWEAFL